MDGGSVYIRLPIKESKLYLYPLCLSGADTDQSSAYLAGMSGEIPTEQADLLAGFTSVKEPLKYMYMVC